VHIINFQNNGKQQHASHFDREIQERQKDCYRMKDERNGILFFDENQQGFFPSTCLPACLSACLPVCLPQTASSLLRVAQPLHCPYLVAHSHLAEFL